MHRFCITAPKRFSPHRATYENILRNIDLNEFFNDLLKREARQSNAFVPPAGSAQSAQRDGTSSALRTRFRCGAM